MRVCRGGYLAKIKQGSIISGAQRFRGGIPANLASIPGSNLFGEPGPVNAEPIEGPVSGVRPFPAGPLTAGSPDIGSGRPRLG